MTAPKRNLDLYGNDVSKQLKAMGIPDDCDTELASQEDQTILGIPEHQKEAIVAFVQQVERLNADRRFRAARAALLNYRNDQWREVPLEDVLTILANLAVRPSGIRASTRQHIWSLETGKTWKALKEFPGRLRKLAKEIETVNSSPFFGFQNWIIGETFRGKFVTQQFSVLPGSLRVYAAFVESLPAKLASPPATGRMFGSVQRGHSEFVLRISNLVKALTGRFHDEEVSALLNAADLVVDPKVQTPRFHPETLRNLRSRREHNIRRTSR